MSKDKVFWFWHYEDETGTVHTTTDQAEAEKALHEKPLRTIWAERIIATDAVAVEETPIETVKERKYKRGERGLESMERQMLASAAMKRLLLKMSRYYGVQFKTPAFIPVFITGRLKKNDGLHYSDKIVLAKNVLVTSWYKRNLLWHEIIHSVVHDNWGVLWEENKNQGKQLPSYQSFEKQVFRLALNDGSHGSQNWKLSCECGQWLKSVDKRKTWTCPKCSCRLVSKNEYQRLKKIAEIGSTTVTFDLNKYRPWKSNERIA